MTAEQVLAYVNQKGIILTADGDRIKYKAPTGVMTTDIVKIIREHKPGIIGILTKGRKNEYRQSSLQTGCNPDILPGNCDACPAAGYWDFMGSGKWCFHHAYFLGKSEHPKPCNTAKDDCPLKRVK